MKNVKTICVTMVILWMVTPKVMAWTQFNNGTTHNIDYEIRDEVWVDYQAPGMGTTVNWLKGGRMASTWRFVGTEVPTGYRLKGFEDSWINVSGGSTDDLYAYNRSQITISSGRVRELYAFDTSRVSISGGLIDSPLYAYDNSQVTISGGKIRYTLQAHDRSQVRWSGGSIGDTWYSVFDSIWYGETQDNLYVDDEAILAVEGLNFAIDGIPVMYGPIRSVTGGLIENEPLRCLTGILADGQMIHNDFYIGHEGEIILVPEPATLILLGLGAVMGRRRKIYY